MCINVQQCACFKSCDEEPEISGIENNNVRIVELPKNSTFENVKKIFKDI